MAEYWHQVIKINDYQKKRFADLITRSLFHTLNSKRITIFGFAFKKNTGDTRESAAIYISKFLLDEGAFLNILDPKVEEEQLWFEMSNPQLNLTLDMVKKKVKLYSDDVYEACKQSHAIVVCTEWDQFKEYDYKKIYNVMQKPAFIFDGRLILNHSELIEIGFKAEAIGKKFN